MRCLSISRSGIAALAALGCAMLAAVWVVWSSRQTASSLEQAPPIGKKAPVSERLLPRLAVNSELSALLDVPVTGEFGARCQAIFGTDGFELLQAEVRKVGTNNLVDWLEALESGSGDGVDPAVTKVATACLCELARRNHPGALDLAIGKREYCLDFRLIGEALVRADPTKTAALVAKAGSEKIAGLTDGCRFGLLGYFRISGDIATTLGNASKLSGADRWRILEDMDLRALAASGSSIKDIASALRMTDEGCDSGLRYDEHTLSKLGASFSIEGVLTAIDRELQGNEVSALAKGVAQNDPEQAIRWLVVNTDKDPEYRVFKAVVAAWIDSDTTRASQQLSGVCSRPHLKIAAIELARRAEAEGNTEGTAAWLKMASEN